MSVKQADAYRSFDKKRKNSSYKVLDIGSGDKPLKEADVLCEKYLQNNIFRGNKCVVVSNKSLVLADAESLPFREEAVEFIYCNRVVEYTKNPEKTIKEFKRVAISGYVCTPSLVFPNFYGAYCRGDKTIFMPFTKSGIKKRSQNKFTLLFQRFLLIFGFVSGIYTTEIYWGKGIEIFAECYKSNNNELKSVPVFLVKLLLKNRKVMENIRDTIIG